MHDLFPHNRLQLTRFSLSQVSQMSQSTTKQPELFASTTFRIAKHQTFFDVLARTLLFCQPISDKINVL